MSTGKPGILPVDGRLFPVPDLGDMSHFAAGPCFSLAIEMDERTGFRQPIWNGDNIVADQIGHDAIAVAGRIAQWQPGNGADMLFELRDYASRFRPMAGIVDPGAISLAIRLPSAIRNSSSPTTPT